MTKSGANSDAKLRAIRPREKTFQVFDIQGLYLEVNPWGSKIWRFKKMINGKIIRRSIGPFPEISLKDARAKAEDFQNQLANNSTIISNKISLFRDLLDLWSKKHLQVKAASTIKITTLRINKYILPKIGHLNISQITPKVILDNVLRPLEAANNFEVAHRVLNICSQILRFGVHIGAAKTDPSSDLRGALTPFKNNNYPTITDKKLIAKLMKDIFSYVGNTSVVYGLRLLPYLFVRPGELRQAEWEEFDFQDKLWRIPANKMKMKRAHLVPLSDQVLDLLEELKQFRINNCALLFPGTRSKDRPISDVALIAALRYLGYQQGQITPHGFRAMASTLLNENGYNSDWIERQLAHVASGVRAVYNHADYLPERRKMMQDWANMLDSLRLS
jgi:integrase